MKIYRITGSQGKISFNQDIKANDYQDARNKFINNNKKFDSYSTFATQPDIIIESQTLKYSEQVEMKLNNSLKKKLGNKSKYILGINRPILYLI